MTARSVNTHRVRQTSHDLAEMLRRSTPTTVERIARNAPVASVAAASRGLADLALVPPDQVRVATDSPVRDAADLAAALPDEDHQGFVTATALLLLDALNGGDAEDLEVLWDTFAAHYRLADPWQRAALMNAFRLLHRAGRLALDDPPGDEDCLSRSRAHVLALRPAPVLADAVRSADAETAGRLWADRAGSPLSPADLAAFRYLAERPEGMMPPDDTPCVPPPVE